MPLKHGPIEALLPGEVKSEVKKFSMPLKHGPIEAYVRLVVHLG